MLDHQESSSRCQSFHNHNFDDDKQFMTGWNAIASRLNSENEKEEKLLQAKLFYYSKFFQPITLGEYQEWLQVKGSDSDHEQNSDSNIRCQSLPDDVHVKQNTSEDPSSKNQDDLDKKTIPTAAAADTSFYLDSETDQAATLLSPDHLEAKKTNTSDDRKESIDLCDGSAAECTSFDEELDFKHLKLSDDAVSPPIASSGEQCAKELADNRSDEDKPQYPLSFTEIVDLIQKGKPIPGLEELNIEPTNQEPTESCVSRLPKPWEKHEA